MKHLRSQSPTMDDQADHDFNWVNEVKDWELGFVSGQTKLGKTFVRIRHRVRTILACLSFIDDYHLSLQYRFTDTLLFRHVSEHVGARFMVSLCLSLAHRYRSVTWKHVRDFVIRSVCKSMSVSTSSSSFTSFFGYGSPSNYPHERLSRAVHCGFEQTSRVDQSVLNRRHLHHLALVHGHLPPSPVAWPALSPRRSLGRHSRHLAIHARHRTTANDSHHPVSVAVHRPAVRHGRCRTSGRELG